MSDATTCRAHGHAAKARATTNRAIRRQWLETLILGALRTRLVQPEHVATFVEAFTAEWNPLVAEQSAETTVRRRELDRAERKIAGLIAAIADRIRTPGIQQELLQFEARQASLQAELAQTPAAEPPRLHPNLAEVYRERVARLHEALRDGNDGVAILEQVRGLIDRVVPGPTGPPGETRATPPIGAHPRVVLG